MVGRKVHKWTKGGGAGTHPMGFPWLAVLGRGGGVTDGRTHTSGGKE